MAFDHDAYASLRLSDYRLLLLGGLLAHIGLEMQAVAVGYELYLRTKSPWLLGLTGLAQFLPVLFLALPAGQAADRFSRKFLVQGAQFCIAISSLALAVLSWTQGSVDLIFALLVLVGIARAFNAPARTALLPQVVPLELLPNAVAWNTTGWQVASISGPALGGLVLGYMPAWVVYLVSAGCALICVLLLSPIRPVRSHSRPVTARSLEALLAGIRFVGRTELLLAAITLDLFAVLLGGAIALLPLFAEDILKVGAVGLGWLRAAPALGALGMAIVLAHRRPFERPGQALLWAVAGFGMATIGFGISNNFTLSFILLMLTGALDNISVVIRHTLMQVLTPDEMRGRVAAVNTVFISSSNELGAFESGATAAYFGPVWSVIGGGIGTILIVILVAMRWPSLVRLGPLQSLKPAPLVQEAETGTGVGLVPETSGGDPSLCLEAETPELGKKAASRCREDNV